MITITGKFISCIPKEIISKKDGKKFTIYEGSVFSDGRLLSVNFNKDLSESFFGSDVELEVYATYDDYRKQVKFIELREE